MIVVFSGPTISRADVRAIMPEAEVWAPAACGDVYRAAQRRPSAIGIIDGYFDHTPSIWHKEVLWAMQSGVLVYGAGSMGALRAAELSAYGMTGVGEIFEAFRDGILEDDDEVAVVHEDAAHGFRPRSEAMVNIRATLTQASLQGILSSEELNALTQVGKQLFYADRNYAALFRAAAAVDFDRQRLAMLRDWLATHGPRDQKRMDAMAMLYVMRSCGSVAQPAFRLQYTDAFRSFQQQLTRHSREVVGSPHVAQEVEAGGEGLLHEATEQALALLLAERDAYNPSEAAAQEAADRFRNELGLYDVRQTHKFLAEHQLGLAEFTRLVRELVITERYRRCAREAAEQRLGPLRQLKALRGASSTKVDA